MRVVVHDYGGYPFIFDISQQLSLKGLEVYHIYSSGSGSPHGHFTDTTNLKVVDMGANLPKVEKSSFFKRFLQEWSYGKVISKKIIELKPDVVFSADTPLLAQIQLINTCNKNKIYIFHWLQDLLSIAAQKVVSKKNKFLGIVVGYFFFQIEKKCLSNANSVISISNGFSSIIKEWGIDEKKIVLVENWAQINEIPLVSKNNWFSEKYELQQSFNIIYTGTLGMKQNPSVLIEISKNYKNNPNIKIIIIATGDGLNFLKKVKEEQNLTNLICLPLQPYKSLPQVLGSADLLIATLNEDAGDYCVPSKVLTYYCSGKASLLILPINNQAAKLTLEQDLGFVVAPNDYKDLFEKIDFCFQNKDILEEKGKKARLYANKNFKPEIIGNKFISLLSKVY